MEIQFQGQVAVVRMRAGKANAMDEKFLRGLTELFSQVEDSDALAVVLTGYESYFSAGLALPSLLGLRREQLRPFVGLFEKTMRKVFEFPLPVIAAVNGHAIAGGCVLALQCDLRLAADAALKIGLNEVQLGIGLPSAVLEPLRLQIPPSSLPTIAMEGRLFAPIEAQRLGLIHDVVSGSELVGRAVELARHFAHGPRQGFAQVKRGLRRSAVEAMEARAGTELEGWLDTWFSPEAQERIAQVVAQLLGKAPSGQSA